VGSGVEGLKLILVECSILPISLLDYDAWDKQATLLTFRFLFEGFKPLKTMNCFDWLEVYSLATSINTVYHSSIHGLV
jgi:hypothetical protein